jgi:hypothetical protein
VTPELYPTLEADHFAGLATGRVLDADAVAEDLAGYDAGMGVVNRDLVMQHHRVRDHVIELVDAIPAERIGERPPTPYAELSRLVALQWAWVEAAQIARGHVSWVHDRQLEAEAQAAELLRAAEAERERADEATRAAHRAELGRAEATERAAQLGAELERIVGSRAFRISAAYWRTREAVLGPLRRRPVSDAEDRV